MTESEKALEGLCKARRRALVKSLIRRSGSLEDAEDIVQEAFLKAYRNISSYDPSRSMEGWFIRILQNTLCDFLTDRKRSPVIFNDELLENLYAADSDYSLLVEKVRSLASSGDKKAKVAYFRLVQELPVRDVSLLTGMSNREIYRLKAEIEEELS